MPARPDLISQALRTVTIHKAWAVYKDYDGNAPDGPVFARCATEELGNQLAKLLSGNDPEKRDDDLEDNPEFDNFPWPFVDGHEWSARWCAEESEAEYHKIATTLDEAKTMAGIGG